VLYKLTHVIDQAARQVPEALWSPAAVRRMKAAVESFPDLDGRDIGPVRWGVIGLEFRLRAAAEQVDLTFPLLAEDRDTILALGGGVEPWLRRAPAWGRVRELCRCWADGRSRLAARVKLLWIELDMDEARRADAVNSPGVFVRFDPAATADEGRESWQALLSDVLVALTGAGPRPALLREFERCRGALPPGAHVQYVGLMLSRGAEAVRFVFAGPAESDWPAFLEAVGFPGEAARARGELAMVTTAAGRRLHPGPTAIQLDLGPDGVLPRFGAELVLDRAVQTVGRIAERAFLEHLAARGLCTDDKLASLLELPGRSLRPAGDLLVGHARSIHHVKVVFDLHGPTEAKAYYGRALAIERPAAWPRAEPAA
jgi:hypothetical protein